jgi:hypothetical protein
VQVAVVNLQHPTYICAHRLFIQFFLPLLYAPFVWFDDDSQVWCVRKFISCPETSIVGRTQGELGISQHFACGCGQRRLFILDASDFFFSPSAYRRMLFRSRTGTACACVTKKKSNILMKFQVNGHSCNGSKSWRYKRRGKVASSEAKQTNASPGCVVTVSSWLVFLFKLFHPSVLCDQGKWWRYRRAATPPTRLMQLSLHRLN